MGKLILIIIIVIVILGGGGYWLMNRSDSKTTTPNPNTSQASPTPTPTTSSSGNPSTAPASESASKITYTDNGFQPSNLTVKAGTTVTVTNSASDSLQFDSNPHPEHTDNTELNIGFIAKGESKTMTLNKVGTWKYHNHLNNSDQGTITVQ